MSIEFLKKYNNKKNIRYESFEFTLKEALKRNLKNIVETGTSRGKIKFFFFRKLNWKDGMSTIIFSEYAKNNNGHLYTCDISKENIISAKKFTKKFKKFISYYIDDSINFLNNFSNKIDLLYLDSLDGHNEIAASKHQLKEIEVSINKLHNNSLVLLDDVGLKTNLSIEYLLQKGFLKIFETQYQILFSRKN